MWAGFSTWLTEEEEKKYSTLHDTDSPNNPLTATIQCTLYNNQDVWLNKETSVLAHCQRCAALTMERSGWMEGGRGGGELGREGTWARGNQEEEVAAHPSLCQLTAGNETTSSFAWRVTVTRRRRCIRLAVLASRTHTQAHARTQAQSRCRNNTMVLMQSAHCSQPHVWATCKQVQPVKSGSAVMEIAPFLLFFLLLLFLVLFFFLFVCKRSHWEGCSAPAHLVCRLSDLSWVEADWAGKTAKAEVWVKACDWF